MKTVNEVATTYQLNRSTLLKAAQQGRLEGAASQSGSIWLVDDTSEKFQTWLKGGKMGRPRMRTQQ